MLHIKSLHRGHRECEQTIAMVASRNYSLKAYHVFYTMIIQNNHILHHCITVLTL